MLTSANSADIAVGYFFMSGFNAVAEEFSRLDKVRLLVGRTDRQTVEEIAIGLQQADAVRARLGAEETIRRSQRSELASQAVRAIAAGVALLPQTGESEADVSRLREFIASGKIEVRSYVKSRLHAKAYLCWYPNHAEPGAAIVGSSNFTLSGFSGNTELNVRVTGDAEMAVLKRWFEALWADSVDVTADVALELDRSWAIANTPPYHVYLKALLELYKDQLEIPELELTRRGGPELPDFQLDAVRRGLAMLDLHGGCFIGDVVGLGKTFVGAELLRQLSYTERPPLIICPAGLVPMWERTNELFGLGAEVVSMSRIVPPPSLRFDEESEEYVDDEPRSEGIVLRDAYPNRGSVLVDEVHNFRNQHARRYRALTDYLSAGDHKAILLSATPQNLGPKDIYYQLRLFLDDIDHGLDIEPLRLEDYFGAVQKWYEYRIELENWQQDYLHWQLQPAPRGQHKGRPPVPPTQPTVPFATIEQVLNPTFIRRRRRDIRELYGDEILIAGRKVQFPEPILDNLAYRLDCVYAKAGSLADLQATLGRHSGSRYRAADYVKPDKRMQPQYRDLLRARNRVASLIRHLLFKRLESSVAAFKSTLDVLIQSNRNFRIALEEGFVPIGQTATRLLSGEELDPTELLQVLQAEESRRKAVGAKRSTLVHPTADFDVELWRKELDSDWEVLQEVRDRIEPITPGDDDKLAALRAFLEKNEVREGKVIVFSEAETTVDYLFDQLNPGGHDPSIAKVSGSNRGQLQDTIKRFAPNANLRQGERIPGIEVRVLIATDVVSEGQNLQDCNRVLNYDLHWNPVRLIQRFGRVDRIGTVHTEIHLHNMWPDLDVDAQLSLTDRLIGRIQAFHDFIGLDSRLLSANERINPEAMYRIYAERKLPDEDDVLDEVASFQRGISLLQKLQKDDPDLWATIEALPDGIRSALTVTGKADNNEDRSRYIQNVLKLDETQLPLASPRQEAGIEPAFEGPAQGDTVILLKTGERTGAYAIGDDLKPKHISPGQFVAAVECDPDEATATMPLKTNERVMAAFDAFKLDAASRLGRARRPGSDTRLRRFLARSLRIAREANAPNADELRRISVLQQIFLDHLPSNVLGELAEVRKMDLQGLALIKRLEALRLRFRLNPPDPDDSTDLSDTVEVLRIICSDGLVAAS